MKTIEEIKQELKGRIDAHAKNLNNGYTVSTIQCRQYKTDRALLTAIEGYEILFLDNDGDMINFVNRRIQTIREQWGE